MTLKDDIVRELLDAARDPAGLAAALRRHSHSKGPFYLALAEATTRVRQQLQHVVAETQAAEAEHHRLQGQLVSLDRQRREMADQAKRLGEERERAEGCLKEVRGLLERAEALAQQGFGEKELTHLAALLAQVAASQGAPPEEGVAQFFRTVERYERIVSLDLEATRAETRAAAAKAQAARWEAEAQRREAHSKARTTTIDSLERLLGQGVKEQDLPQWQKIVAGGGVSSEGLAKALEKHSSLAALVRATRQERDALGEEARQLEAQVRALQEQKEGLAAAIDAVRAEGIGQVRLAGRQVAQELQALRQVARDYGALQQQAEGLRELLALAQAFKERDAQAWRATPLPAVVLLLQGSLLWTEEEGRDVRVEAPEPVRRALLSSYYGYRLPLSHVLLWALSAFAGESGRRALLGSG